MRAEKMITIERRIGLRRKDATTTTRKHRRCAHGVGETLKHKQPGTRKTNPESTNDDNAQGGRSVARERAVKNTALAEAAAAAAQRDDQDAQHRA